MKHSKRPDVSTAFDPIVHSPDPLVALLNLDLLMGAVDDEEGARGVILPLFVQAIEGKRCPMKRFRALVKVVQESVFGESIITRYLGREPITASFF